MSGYPNWLPKSKMASSILHRFTDNRNNLCTALGLKQINLNDPS